MILFMIKHFKSDINSSAIKSTIAVYKLSATLVKMILFKEMGHRSPQTS